MTETFVSVQSDRATGGIAGVCVWGGGGGMERGGGGATEMRSVSFRLGHTLVNMKWPKLSSVYILIGLPEVLVGSSWTRRSMV